MPLVAAGHHDVARGQGRLLAGHRQPDRVIAVGTTVVRALEGAAADGEGRMAARTGWTAIRLGAGYQPQIVDAFAPDAALAAALEQATREGYLDHEFGDAMVVI